MLWLGELQCTLVIVLATFAAALVEGSLPYFPIEISRAAANRYGQCVFGFGIVMLLIWSALHNVLLVMADVEDPVDFGTSLASFGLLAIALFDDVHSYKLHMLGVVVLILGTACKAFRYASDGAIALLGVALAIYTSRLALKALSVYAYELAPSALPNADTKSLQAIVIDLGARSRDIMLHGRTKNVRTLWVFRLCGVLQWIALGLCALIHYRYQ